MWRYWGGTVNIPPVLDEQLKQLFAADSMYNCVAARFPHVEFADHVLAKRIYSAVFHSDFEFFSHFLGQIDCRYQRTPEVFIKGLAQGYGGTCFEKNLALKYLFQRAGFMDVDFVFGGSIKGSQKPFDETKAEEIGIHSWVSGEALPQTLHCATVLRVGGDEYIFDPNNGRMGPIVTSADETAAMLRDNDKAYYEMYNGKMYYQRIPTKYHDKILHINQGDDLFGLKMAMMLGVLVRDNYDILATTMRDELEAVDRWSSIAHFSRVKIISLSDDFRERAEEAEIFIEERTLRHLQKALLRINEIALDVDGEPRFFAIRVFDYTWHQMSRLSTWWKNDHP